MIDDADRHLQHLVERGSSPTDWFEELYVEAESGSAEVPWDRGGPQPLLQDWSTDLAGAGDRALVVGCGFGEDAELVAGLGYETVGFDVAPSAIEAARQRHPDTKVDYRVANLLTPPPEWRLAFDLVVESLTVQSMPQEYHSRAIEVIGDFVAPGGTLAVIASARDDGEPAQAPPWPLTRAELELFGQSGLVPVEIEDIREGGHRRWRARFTRPH